jgi:hypothetical protein
VTLKNRMHISKCDDEYYVGDAGASEFHLEEEN